MKNEILAHIDNPAALEKMYRANKASFKREFAKLYPELQGNTVAACWQERLQYESEDISWGSRQELVFVILGGLIAGFLAKLPSLIGIDPQVFYPRNIGFIVFPGLLAYFAWRNHLSAYKIFFIAGITVAGLLFINALPHADRSDTLVLSCVHLLLVLWSVLGFAFVGERKNNPEKRLHFLRYNGELLVMAALIVIAGGILSGITIGLFSLIGLRIEQFYMENIAVFGLAAVPLAATYLTQTNPQLVGKVSPVIAKIFSPLVLVMLVVYLIAMAYSGNDPYNNRDFLLIFNALLIGVMALIFFSAAEATKAGKKLAETWVLFLLSIITIVVNGIALSAILFRISEWGLTPNRAAVLGGNVLILINLVLVTIQLYRALFKKADMDGVGRAITNFLPVYFVWVSIVTFLFPFLFQFR
ncbi:DUF4153 domain-containing protein [Flavisolibacter sp. BT320]|nr:DUF4153 domain-containing protein [Flavisolibacter longurius]